MIRLIAVATLLLSGCSGNRAPDPGQTLDPFARPQIVPVTLQQLRGQDVLIFPDIAPQKAFERLASHLERCRASQDRRILYDPSGMRLVGRAGDPRLSMMFAQVSESSAIALDGPDFSPLVKEELAMAAQGESRCLAT